MGFVESISSVLANSFNFRDRASRSEYWYWNLFITILWMGIIVFSIMTSSAKYTFVPHFSMFILYTLLYLLVVLKPYLTFILLLALLILIPSLSVTVRRLHDAGYSGWWYFVSLVPYIGILTLLYLTVLPSQNGGNKWGGNPSGDNGTSGLKDIYENAVAKATSMDNPMDNPAVRNMTPRQQQPVMSGAPVTFGKR